MKRFKAMTHLFFLLPIESGLFGFAAFFIVILTTKLLHILLFKSHEIFEILIDDVYLSLLGFGLTFIMKLLKIISTRQSIIKTTSFRR